MSTNKKSPTPLDIFPNGKVKKPKAKPVKVNEKKFQGKIDLEKLKEAFKNRKTLRTNVDVAREVFGYGGIVNSVDKDGHTVGVYVNTNSGYALIMEWGVINDVARLTLRDEVKLFENAQDLKEYCVKAYYENPYRSVERYNVNRHW